MKKSTLIVLIAFFLVIHPAHAASPCTAVIVQADDWLSKIAAKHLGDQAAYGAIVNATNEVARSDSSYIPIDDPDRIEIGQKLCVPVVAQRAPMSVAGENDVEMLFSSYTIKWVYRMPDGQITACFLQYEKTSILDDRTLITWDCVTSDDKTTETETPKFEFEGPKS
jgi:hypothetical protein